MFDGIIHNFIISWGYYAVFSLCAPEGFGFFFVPGDTRHLEIAWLLLAAFSGNLAQRHGARRLLALFSAASAGGLAVVGAGPLWVGALAVV